ncbi:cobalt-precorrin 5A hydrolase [Marinomonas epiphytica]
MIRIFALTPEGLSLAQELNEKLQSIGESCQLDYKPIPFAKRAQQAFINGEKLIFICATGIVIRSLAPVLQNKHQDPPVLALDEQGQFVIPLLSGHEGGANDLAKQVSELLLNQLVMTTANAYVEPTYTLGMGCERHCPLAFLESLMLEALASKGLSPADIHSLNSINIKADEVGLIQLAKKYQWPFHTYSAQQLNTMTDLLSTRSDYVFKTVGVYGVAESAALLASHEANDQPPELVLKKIKNTKATCSIARSYKH